MPNKFYAVKLGRKTGIFQTWEECKKQIDGFSTAIYKSFKTLEEAEEFLNSENEVLVKNNVEDIDVDWINNKIDDEINNLSIDEVIAFVDGTYLEEEKENKTTKISGYGVIIIKGERW